MMARAFSGSISSIISVEPLMSANSAVTVLRSPSGGESGSAATVIGTDLFDGKESALRACAASQIKRAPHFLQNFEPGAFTTAHDGHTRSSLAPHSAQKTASARFSLRHLGQTITG